MMIDEESQMNELVPIQPKTASKSPQLSLADFIKAMTDKDGIGQRAIHLATALGSATCWKEQLERDRSRGYRVNDGCWDEGVMKSIAEGEAMMSDRGFNNLVADIPAWKTPATLSQIKSEIATLLAAFPSKEDLAAFTAILICDVDEVKPSRIALALACRQLRHTLKFRPSICEVLEALKEQKDRYPVYCMDAIPRIPDYIAKLRQQREESLRQIEHQEAVPFDCSLVREQEPAASSD
jgi:hypothetical protein